MTDATNIPDSRENPHGSRTDSLSDRLGRSLALPASVIGTCVGMYVLNPTNRFDATPWHHDDYANLLASFHSPSVRPLSTLIIDLLAWFGESFYYVALVGLLALNVWLISEFAIRFLRVDLSAGSKAVAVFCIAGVVALYEDTPEIVRYTGTITNLLSICFGFLAAHSALSLVRGWRGAGPLFVVLVVLSVLCKEDTFLFVFLVIAVETAFQWRSLDRRMRIHVLAYAIGAGVLSAATFLFLLRSEHSFISKSLSGTGGYRIAGSISDVLQNAWAYVHLTRYLAFLSAAFFVVPVALVLMKRQPHARSVRYVAVIPLVACLMLPYVVLDRSRIFQYYAINWLPLIVASIVVILAGSMMVSTRRHIALLLSVCLIALSAAFVYSQPSRISIAAWLNMQQSRSAAILGELRRHGESLHDSSPIFVSGLDDGFSPFFFTDGSYVNSNVVGAPKEWILLVRNGSFVQAAYHSTGRPTDSGYVEVRPAEEGVDASPLLAFDAELRARRRALPEKPSSRIAFTTDRSDRPSGVIGGIYSYEGRPGRWTADEFSFQLYVPPDANVIEMVFDVPALGPFLKASQGLTMRFPDGTAERKCCFRSGSHRVSLTVPPGARGAEQVFSVKTDIAFVPAKTGQSGDLRSLGIILHRVELK